MNRLLLFFDGACEPINPGGLATYGFVIRQDEGRQKGRFIHSGLGTVGQGAGITNNVAEYFALGHGLRWLVDAGRTAEALVIRGDSKLVIEQVSLRWQCKAAHLVQLRDRCTQLLSHFATWQAEWIPRDQNEDADRLSRTAWEDVMQKPFPERPTKRKRVPGFERKAD